MTGFGQHVGVRFRERMSGFLAKGAKTPEDGAQLGQGKQSNFSFALDVAIPSLTDFLARQPHTAQVAGGTVEWAGVANAGTAVAGGGSIVLFRNVAANGRKKVCDFLFSFRDGQGRDWTLTGEKRLFDDSGFDAAADLSTLWVRLIDGTGKTAAAGKLDVSIGAFLEEMASTKITQASKPGEDLAALVAFAGFLNRQVGQVYDDMPRIFTPDTSLRPDEWRVLKLIAVLMLKKHLPLGGPSADDVAAGIETFVQSASPADLEEIRSRLRLLAVLEPVAKGLLSEIQKLIRTHLLDDKPTDLRVLLDQVHQIAVLPYYAHPKADALVAYKRPTFLPKAHLRLKTIKTPSSKVFDVTIVGAGVAGSLLAARLAAAGKSVLILESGPYVAEQDISTDEIRWTARLYKQAGLQAANAVGPEALKTGPVPILQGTCVGGGGTVNNAICFQMPTAQMARWTQAGFPYSDAEVRRAYSGVVTELSIQPVPLALAPGAHANPAGDYLVNAFGPVQRPRVDAPPPVGLSECLVNIDDCLGQGLCNTGCGSERKRNGLQVHLPAAVQHGAEVVANATVRDITLAPAAAGKPRRVAFLSVDVGGTVVQVQAKEFVLSAGAIASSALLLKAKGLGNVVGGLPVGKRFSANVGCPSFAFFDTPIHPRPSLQISHAFFPKDGSGFVIESWFAPPGSLAVVVPGYFETHWERMHAYDRIAVAAPLVGTEPNGRVSVDGKGKTRVELPLGALEITTLRKGVATLVRAFLAGGPRGKAKQVVAGTRRGFPIKDEAGVLAFEQHVQHAHQLRLGTGHPQGGNALSKDLSISVLDPEFRVRGIENLRVCDASAFPLVAGVNPQWTVMALAQLCAEALGAPKVP